MELSRYVLEDNVAKLFSVPFFEHNDETAKRYFHALIQDPKTQYHQAPADYTLWKLGTFSQDDAAEKSFPIRTLIIRGGEFPPCED